VSTPQIKVLFVDDNRQLLAAWQRLISQQPDMAFAGSLTSADELPEAARRIAPDVVLVDLSMDGMDPLDAISAVSRSCPTVRTIVYSGHSRDEWRTRVRDAGAADFIDKSEDPAKVLALIRSLAGAR
jgi:DNA-binding NarL/FixJ family response regulator